MLLLSNADKRSLSVFNPECRMIKELPIRTKAELSAHISKNEGVPYSSLLLYRHEVF
jgi:hypothetical protein